jgi:hypothetical protein
MNDKVFAQQVIICTKQRRGKGSLHSPIRVITEVFDMEGNLIADNDPIGNLTPETILDFLRYHYNVIPEADHVEKLRAYFIEEWEDEQQK